MPSSVFVYCGYDLQVDSPFWSRVVLQTSHAEPAVKHAVLKLAAMHSGMLDRDDQLASRQHMLHAKEQYTLALGAARKLVTDATSAQIHRVLIVCLLFVAWEGVQGDYQAAQRHMHSGRVLAGRFDLESPPDGSTDIAGLSMNTDFRDIQEASASLVDITRWLLRLGNELMPGIDAAEDSQRQRAFGECTMLLKQWPVHWENWYTANAGSSGSLPTLNVRLWYACAKALVDTGFSGPETRYDKAADRFCSVVVCSEKLSSAIFQKYGAVSFSLDLGYLIPTFFAAMRCRDPGIRRRALGVLRSYLRHEGAWQSGPAAIIAERWMAVEERGLEDVTEAAHIPAQQRVVLMEVQVRKSDGRARLRFQSAGADDAYVVQEDVSW